MGVAVRLELIFTSKRLHIQIVVQIRSHFLFCTVYIYSKHTCKDNTCNLNHQNCANKANSNFVKLLFWFFKLM